MKIILIGNNPAILAKVLAHYNTKQTNDMEPKKFNDISSLHRLLNITNAIRNLKARIKPNQSESTFEEDQLDKEQLDNMEIELNKMAKKWDERMRQENNWGNQGNDPDYPTP